METGVEAETNEHKKCFPNVEVEDIFPNQSTSVFSRETEHNNVLMCYLSVGAVTVEWCKNSISRNLAPPTPPHLHILELTVSDVIF